MFTTHQLQRTPRSHKGNVENSNVCCRFHLIKSFDVFRYFIYIIFFFLWKDYILVEPTSKWSFWDQSNQSLPWTEDSVFRVLIWKRWSNPRVSLKYIICFLLTLAFLGFFSLRVETKDYALGYKREDFCGEKETEKKEQEKKEKFVV